MISLMAGSRQSNAELVEKSPASISAFNCRQ